MRVAKVILLISKDKNMQIEDKEIREELSKILDSYKDDGPLGYSHSDKKLVILSWVEIAYEIGKLKKID